MMPWEEARDRILAQATSLSSEEVLLHDAAGRICREAITAPFPMPRFAASAMDGYAVRHQDLAQATEENPIHLPITQHIAAARAPETPLQQGECARIFTGAPLPEDADTVVMQEEVQVEGSTAIFRQAPKPHDAVRSKGSEFAQGTLLLDEGMRLSAGDIGLLAGVGRASIRVTRKPRVAILACGSELKRFGESLGPADIYESNRHALAVQLRQAGAEPILLPIVPDEMELLLEQLQEGLKADILLTSGGASVGDYDLLRPALQKLGVTTHFWKVAIRPGKPLFFGQHHQCLVFGLPGNPASSMVTFEIFVRPAIQKLLHNEEIARPRLQATLTQSAPSNTKRTHFVRGKLSFSAEGPTFTPLRVQNSSDLLSMRQAQALAILPPASQPASKGQIVDVLWLTTPNT